MIPFTPRLPFLLLAAITVSFPVVRGQTLDVPPRGAPNERAVQGGSYRVRVDSITLLPDLIKRLGGCWDLVETGKAYWIGYTDDMYSIAAHKDAAVEPLLALFRETKDQHTKNGVVLTLHLIGINSTIVGRFDERFLDASARKALLGLIDDEGCGDLAIELLARDPWPTDVPFLVDSLAKGKRPRNVLINALFRYARGDTPFRQDIDETWDNIAIDFRDKTGQKNLGKLRLVVREKKTDEPEKINKMIRDGLVIQWGKDGRIVRELMTSDNGSSLKQVLGNQKPTEVIYDLFLLSKEKVSVFSFCDLDEEFWHTVEPQRLVIVGPETARQMWLDYFRRKNLPAGRI